MSKEFLTHHKLDYSLNNATKSLVIVSPFGGTVILSIHTVASWPGIVSEKSEYGVRKLAGVQEIGQVQLGIGNPQVTHGFLQGSASIKSARSTAGLDHRQRTRFR